MFQIKAQCGYEIQVISKGDDGPCRIANSNNSIVFCGTWDDCRKWLADRGVKTIG